MCVGPFLWTILPMNIRPMQVKIELIHDPDPVCEQHDLQAELSDELRTPISGPPNPRNVVIFSSSLVRFSLPSL